MTPDPRRSSRFSTYVVSDQRTGVGGKDLRSTIINVLASRQGLDPANQADEIMVELGYQSGYDEDGEYTPGYREWAVEIGLISEPTFAVVVMSEEGRNLCRGLESHASLDVNDLSRVGVSLLPMTLGQIIDQGHEWGAYENYIEDLHRLVSTWAELAQAGSSNSLSFTVPDGWTISARRNDR